MKQKNYTLKSALLHLLQGLFILILVAGCQRKTDFSDREMNFDNGWKFYRGNIPGAEAMDFDDSQWRTLDLPHDWAIEDLPASKDTTQIGPFTKNSIGGTATGFTVGEVGWYRKTFTLDKSAKNKKIQVYFDGVYQEADVWINAQHVGFHAYGYTPFYFNLTPYIKHSGEKNVLTVKVKNLGKTSRWYSGSGIYRHVKLITTEFVNIPVWGIFVSTPEVTAQQATVQVETSVDNITTDDVDVTVSTQILSPDNQPVAQTNSDIKTTSGGDNKTTQTLHISGPKLWSPETPVLYTAVSEIKYEGMVVDKKSTVFGIRKLEFSAEKGFLLNGEPLLLKGGCMHHDNGPLGSATIDRAEERRVELMKKFGFNAIRTSHNPPSQQFLDACERLGVLVIDEAFDQWQRPKNPEDYNRYFDKYHRADLESMVLRDRNHPSVIMWSIGNEINERADTSGLKITKELYDIVKNLDQTRPVTEAICEFWDHQGRPWEATAPTFALLDVGGYNYQWRRYEPDHEKYPERMMIGTESVPKEAFENWQQVENHPYVLGDFVWTAMDYYGEAGIGHAIISEKDAKPQFSPGWPWYNAYCGDIDVCGFKKPQSYYRDVVWKISKLEMAVNRPVPSDKKEIVSYWGWPDERQSWNWKGNEGKLMYVNVYSNYPQVRLELNGKAIGTQPVSAETKLTATFTVPYEAGELKAIGMQDGKDVETKILKTTGEAAKIRLTADRTEIRADRNDLAYVTVEVTDEAGQLVPDAALPVNFTIGGDCTLAGVENGNPTDMKSFQTPKVTSFKGKCLVVLRPTGKSGKIKLTAESVGLEKAEIEIAVK